MLYQRSPFSLAHSFCGWSSANQIHRFLDDDSENSICQFINAAGCPNNLVAGYFMTELLTIILVGSGLGVVRGFLMDLGVSNWVFSSYKFPNFWFGPGISEAFFVFHFCFWGFQTHISPPKGKQPPRRFTLNCFTFGAISVAGGIIAEVTTNILCKTSVTQIQL